MTQTAVYQAKPIERLVSRIIDSISNIEYTALFTGVCPYKLGLDLEKCPRYRPTQTSHTRNYPKKRQTVVQYLINQKMEDCNVAKPKKKILRYDPDERDFDDRASSEKVWKNYQFLPDRWLKCNTFRESLVDDVKTSLSKDKELEQEVLKQLYDQLNIERQYSVVLDVSIETVTRIISSFNPGECIFKGMRCRADYKEQMAKIEKLSGLEKQLNDPCTPEITTLERYRNCKDFDKLLLELIVDNVIFYLNSNNGGINVDFFGNNHRILILGKHNT